MTRRQLAALAGIPVVTTLICWAGDVRWEVGTLVTFMAAFAYCIHVRTPRA